jgi:beta-galactosidase
MPENLPANIYSIDLSTPHLSTRSGHLRMGGKNPSGVEISANSRFLTFNGKPWTPVMGEMHFSRYPRSFWRDELLKIKAGGVQIVATYIFWNHHEEIEGSFDWSGSRDLRAFVSLCGELGLYSYPRLGPWAHGEARLGGFPDWLLQKCSGIVRQDAQPYLGYAKILYGQIAAQLRGLLWKDGGPVVGVQLENELVDQPGHILTFKHLAREAGLDVPLYTMTGWGPAQVPEDEVIPVFGGYPDAPWDRHHDDWSRPSRKHYFFSTIRDDNAIGADLALRSGAHGLSYLERYPYGTCELGGGVQVTYHRRPWIRPEDVADIPFCKLGGGANMLGYYMYHGGTNPLDASTTLQESQASGYPNDLPVCSYDFQAPLGEAGQVREQYHQLRLLHLFLQDFGSKLAPLAPELPSIVPASLDDRETLRWAVRTDGKQAYLFANNYQRIEGLPFHPAVQFELRMKDEVIHLPSQPFELKCGTRLLWPVNFDLAGIRLKYASANLVCRLAVDGIPTFVFSTAEGIDPEFAFDERELVSFSGSACTFEHQAGVIRIHVLMDGPECLVQIQGRRHLSARILVLSAHQAARVSKANLWGQDRLFLSRAALIFDEDTLRLRSTQADELAFGVYPAPEHLSSSSGSTLIPTQLGIFKYYQILAATPSIPLKIHLLRSPGLAPQIRSGQAQVAQAPSEEDYQFAGRWKIEFGEFDGEVPSQVYLSIRYVGDTARAFLGSRLVADDFWYGKPWEIGLKHLDPSVWKEGLELEILPLRKDAPVYIPPEQLPAFDHNGQAFELLDVTALAEIETIVRLAP